MIKLVYLQIESFFCKLFEEFKINVLLLKLRNGEFNILDTKDPYTLPLHGLEGIYENVLCNKVVYRVTMGKEVEP